MTPFQPRDLWQDPPALASGDWHVRSIRGAQVALLRALILGGLGPEQLKALERRLSPEVAALLDRAPEAEDWVPISALAEMLSGAEAEAGRSFRGSISRLTAERDAGSLPDLPSFAKDLGLRGLAPEAVLASVDRVFGAHFQGGGARLDHLEEGEAWVSLWMEEFIPGFASEDVVEWLSRVLEASSGVRPQVRYRSPQPDRPWWHRYHLGW